MKKIGLICLALVLALGALGVGFAMWSDEVTIGGTVQTGSVDVAIASQYDNDAGRATLDPSEMGTWDVSGATPAWTGARTKAVAETTSTFTADTATIKIVNAYPCYWSSVIFDILNNGSIPVGLKNVKLIALSKNGQTTWTGDMDLLPNTRYYVDVDVPNVDTTLDAGDDFSFYVSTYGTNPIDPRGKGYIDVSVHLEQDAEQSGPPGPSSYLTSYDFTIKAVYAQFNEVP